MSPAFMPLFNQNGKDVWNEWDKFLDQPERLSSAPFPMKQPLMAS
jgi:hypothetical protein